MGFWEEFALAYNKIWAFFETPMNFGGISFTYADVILTTALCSLVIKLVCKIIYDER